jgi:tetratricopeptide (TPR) repeat protein
MDDSRLETLLARLKAARDAEDGQRGNAEQLRLHRELVKDSPAFIPNLLALARLVLTTEEPGVDAEASLAEIQRLLEMAVQASERSAPTLLELAYFLDDIRGREDEALCLMEEGAARSLQELEDAWAGLLLRYSLRGQLPKALELAARAEQVFPTSERIQDAVRSVRESALRAGLIDPTQD